ncbi:MAG: BrnT family toxin [Bacteriovoracaceae bacterium]|nr:BrnT family toxin [Bacteriovoracaceae bacterium]
MRYSWDEKKARINFEKHGIRFEEAQVIWSDPFAIEFLDSEEILKEERYLRIGINPARGTLLVVYCERDDGETIRIISARRATSFERQTYEKELRS